MRIAVFTKNMSNPAYGAARLGAERAAAWLGAQVAHYVPRTPDDPREQSALVVSALADAPDAIVLAAVHPTRVNAALDAARAARVPIFGFVNPVPGGSVSYVGASDARLGADVARFVFDHLDGSGDVAVVAGPAESPTSIARVRAFEAQAARHPGIRIVARCHGDYQRTVARDAFAGVLAAHARVDAVLAANDVMALGVLDALAAAGRRAAVAGVNAIPEAVEAIGRGEMLASADFNAMQMCFLATECAIRHLRGEPVPGEIELPVSVVERSNWSRWNLPYAKRALATLSCFAESGR